MNIFVLDSNPRAAAQAHLDKHVVKMVLESAQMLSTAHRLLSGNSLGELPGEHAGFKLAYKATHANHPCAKWARETDSNYRWLYELMVELDLERQYRFTPVTGKTLRDHGSFLSKPPLQIPSGALTPFAQAMPDDVRNSCAVEAYRRCYMKYKVHIARWTKRNPPTWFSAEIESE